MSNIKYVFFCSQDENDASEDSKSSFAAFLAKEIGPELAPSNKVCRRKRSKRLKTNRGVYEHLIAPPDGCHVGSEIIEERAYYSLKSFRSKDRVDRNPVPTRKMTMNESKAMHPNIPHRWVCDGRLLILEEPNHPGNIKLFQETWIRGQPVIVANVSKKLNPNLWSPHEFSRRFGHIRHDIVNTKTNKIIPKVPLKMFWDGFTNLNARMTDELGMPMLLKLKDWPADNDFAKALPEHFDDLMRVIPLKEYTQRKGKLNLAGYMPDFHIQPDLGPKVCLFQFRITPA